MPIDQWGVRADIIMDGDSTIKRMNIGRMYEQYINATSRWVTEWVKEHIAADNYASAYELLRKYYSTASPMMYSELVQKHLTSVEKWRKHVDWVAQHGVSLWVPPDSPNLGDAVIRELRDVLPIPIGPVTYRGRSGKLRTTKADVLIGSMYIILLEKTGEDWAAVASARRQHYGILARLTNRDKYSRPGREQPVRILGEAEVRLLAAYAGPLITADLLEYPNSPGIQKEISRQFLTAEKPTALTTLIDRRKYRRGSSRALLFVKHIVECGGVRYTNQ